MRAQVHTRYVFNEQLRQIQIQMQPHIITFTCASAYVPMCAHYWAPTTYAKVQPG